LDAPLRQVMMHVQFGANDAVGPDDRAGPRQQIAFAIVIIPRHHRAVETEQGDVERHGRTQLVENLVAQALIAGLRNQPCRLRPGRGSFDQREAVGLRPPPGCNKRGRAKCRRFRMCAWGAIKGSLEGAPINKERGEGIGLGCQRSNEHAHRMPQAPEHTPAAHILPYRGTRGTQPRDSAGQGMHHRAPYDARRGLPPPPALATGIPLHDPRGLVFSFPTQCEPDRIRV
jgi:hypothetical protein